MRNSNFYFGLQSRRFWMPIFIGILLFYKNDSTGFGFGFVRFNFWVDPVVHSYQTTPCKTPSECDLPIPIPGICCPAGTLIGPNEFCDGEFNFPGTCINATTDYIFFTGPAQGSGSYTVGNSATVAAANGGNWVCVGKKGLTDNFMIIDGAASNLRILSQVINVNPNTDYSIQVSMNCIDRLPPFLDPAIDVYVNSGFIGQLQAPFGVGWVDTSWCWRSNALTTVANITFRTHHNSGANDFALDEISLRQCIKQDTCICGDFDLWYGIGRGPLVDHHCGETVDVPSSGALLPIRFAPEFKCQGTKCTGSTLDWILEGPPGTPFVNQGGIGLVPTPGFIIPISNSTFVYPGIYTLHLVGHCGVNDCTCELYFNAEGYHCCEAFSDFCNSSMNAVQITQDPKKCKANLIIQNLQDCASVTQVNWGDGTVDQNNYTNGSMPMHVYGSSGLYYISWMITEKDSNANCFNKVFRDSLQLVCDTCKCGGTSGSDWICNGDFQLVNALDQNFCNNMNPVSSDYTYFSGPPSLGSGSYTIGNAATVSAVNGGNWMCNGINGPGDNFMIVDGGPITSRIWEQKSIPLLANAKYEFSFAANCIDRISPVNNPSINVFVNNILIGNLVAPYNSGWKILRICWMNDTSKTATITLKTHHNAGPNDFALDEIRFGQCVKKDTCICGDFDLWYGIGRGPLLNHHCGETVDVPSSGALLPIRFLPEFKCKGNNCNAATVDWLLEGPIGSAFVNMSGNGLLAVPGFTIPISNSTFVYPGIYTLHLIGHCGTNDCPCILYFNADGYRCCEDFSDFCNSVMNSVQILQDSKKCKASLNIQNLQSCASLVQINWGDGTVDNNTYMNGGMPMHVYGMSGFYYISWTISEKDGGIKCFDKVFRDSLRLVCDTCKCGGSKGFDLICNGDFQLVNPVHQNFCNSNNPVVSDYKYFSGPPSLGSGSYTIGNAATVSAVNGGNWMCNGINGPGDNFMIVDGGPVNSRIWEQNNIPITAHAKYEFSFAAYGMDRVNPLNDPRIAVYINNTLMGNVIASYNSGWQYFKICWTNDTAKTATITLRTLHNKGPNDFTLDEIHFTECKKTTVAVKNTTEYKFLQMYPNPCDDIISVLRSENSEPIRRVEFFDLNGKKWISLMVNDEEPNNKFDVSVLQPGVYFVQFFGNRNLIETKKLLKK